MKKIFSIIFNIWLTIFSIIKKHPVVLLPFLYMILFDFLLLIIVFLFPQPPVSIVLAPIVKTFWGEKFLHYPMNLLFLPQFFTYARNFVGIFANLFFTGIIICFINLAYENKTLNWWTSTLKVIKKYLRIFLLWLIVLAVVYVLTKTAKTVPFLKQSSYKIQFGIEFFINIFVQTVFLFAIPAIILENKKVYSSIVFSFKMFQQNPVTSFFIVFIPGLLFVPLGYIFAKIPFLIDKTYPEIVLYAMVFRIIVINFIDFLITSSATIFLSMKILKHL